MSVFQSITTTTTPTTPSQELLHIASTPTPPTPPTPRTQELLQRFNEHHHQLEHTLKKRRLSQQSEEKTATNLVHHLQKQLYLAQEEILRVENARAQANRTIQSKDNIIKGLYEQRDRLIASENSLRAKSSPTDECDTKIQEANCTIQELQVQNSSLIDQLAEVRQSLLNSEKSAQNVQIRFNSTQKELGKLKKQKGVAFSEKTDNQSLRYKLDLANQQYEQAQHQIEKLQEHKQSSAFINSLKREKERLSPFEIIANKLAAENERLKSRSCNIERETEQIQSLKERLERLSEQANLVPILKADLASSVAKLQHWKDLIPTIEDVHTPAQFVELVSSLRNEKNTLQNELSSLKEQYNAIQRELESKSLLLDKEKDRTSAIAASYEATIAKQNSIIQLDLREKEYMKSLLDSYIQESTAESDYSELHSERIASLEKKVSELSSFISQSLDKPPSEIEHILNQKRDLEIALEKSESLVALYQHRLGRGEFNSQTTKVLHLSQNPEKMRMSSEEQFYMDKLKTENAVLRCQIEELEKVNVINSGVPASASTVLMLTEYEEKQVAREKDLSAKFELRSNRLKEYFREKISLFREIVFLGDQDCKLISMFAERKEDALLVKVLNEQNSSGKKTPRLELLENEFMERVDKDLKTYLTRFGSIPAFSAALTLALFETQTFIREKR